MKSFLIIATIFIISSCQNRFKLSMQKTTSYPGTESIGQVQDFQAKRLSGSRVQICWHSEYSQQQGEFMVMRKTGMGFFEKIGIVKPKQVNGLIDYAITDINESEDSSFYSIMQVDAKGVKYFSPATGVKGFKKGS
jgi:fibronectin type 3 domain-containing protein